MAVMSAAKLVVSQTGRGLECEASANRQRCSKALALLGQRPWGPEPWDYCVSSAAV
jgi:hypothetical protein